MAAQWKPAQSSDDDDYDDHVSAPLSTTDLLRKITSEVISTQTETINHHKPTVPNQRALPSQTDVIPNPVAKPLTRSTSSDSIVQLLRSAGLDMEVADSRTVKWRHHTVVGHPDQPTGVLVSGTKNLYLDDEYFVFRDSDGQPVLPPTMPPVMSPHHVEVAISVDLPDGEKSENPAKPANITKPRPSTDTPKPNKQSKKNPTKGKKRTAWKTLEIVASKPKIVPGPPEEKGYTGRNRFN